jgi:2',5'-phosphodiesterase
VLISGDFNSTPEWGVIKLVKERHVNSTLEDFRISTFFIRFEFKLICHIVVDQQEMILDLELSHNLHLESACGFPAYTNYTLNFKGCLDYILYDSDHLHVVDTVPMPLHEDVIRDVALPSRIFPSDHIASVCVLGWS